MAENQLIKYMTDTGEVALSPEIIKAYLVSGDPDKVTDQEIMMFLQLCKYQKLNPFLREAYLIKFGYTPASLVVGKEVFTKRAAKIEQSGGWQAGVVVVGSNNELIYREGSLIVPGEKLVGGWCRVYRKDWAEPILNTVSLSEYIRYNKEGKIMHNWQQMPGTMIMKVAIVQGLRNAFPEDFQGMYSQEEMPIDDSKLPTEPINITLEKPPVQPTTSKSQSATNGQALVNQFYEIVKKSGASEEVVKIILNNEVPNNFNEAGKFDWNRISKTQFKALCSLFENGAWQAKYQEIMELEEISNNLPDVANG